MSPRPDPFDEAQPLEPRARAYLDANCAYCHQPGGIGKGGMDLRFSTPLERTGLFAPSVRSGPEGTALFHIRPGNIQASDIHIRMASLGKNAMPPLGRTRVDDRGLALMRRWIESLAEDSLSSTSSPRPKSPWIIHPQERQEMRLDQWNPAIGTTPALRIIHPSGGTVAGISISAHPHLGREEWFARFSRPLPRGWYWIRIETDGTKILRNLLVI